MLVRRGEDALVLDAGTGLQRLVADPALVDGVRRLDVVLTHFHLDHVCGLAYLPALPVRPKAPIACAPASSSRTSPSSPASNGEIGARRRGPSRSALGAA